MIVDDETDAAIWSLLDGLSLLEGADEDDLAHDYGLVKAFVDARRFRAYGAVQARLVREGRPEAAEIVTRMTPTFDACPVCLATERVQCKSCRVAHRCQHDNSCCNAYLPDPD